MEPLPLPGVWNTGMDGLNWGNGWLQCILKLATKNIETKICYSYRSWILHLNIPFVGGHLCWKLAETPQALPWGCWFPSSPEAALSPFSRSSYMMCFFCVTRGDDFVAENIGLHQLHFHHQFL